MENIIIIGIVIIMMLIGVRSTIKHFKGESSCCGGGSSEKVTKKKLKNVIGKKVVTIDGMTCEHCKNRVERVLNDLDGVSARVNLNKKEAVVSFEKETEDDVLRNVIEKAGYTVTGIKMQK